MDYDPVYLVCGDANRSTPECYYSTCDTVFKGVIKLQPGHIYVPIRDLDTDRIRGSPREHQRKRNRTFQHFDLEHLNSGTAKK